MPDHGDCSGLSSSSSFPVLGVGVAALGIVVASKASVQDLMTLLFLTIIVCIAFTTVGRHVASIPYGIPASSSPVAEKRRFLERYESRQQCVVSVTRLLFKASIVFVAALLVTHNLRAWVIDESLGLMELQSKPRRFRKARLRGGSQHPGLKKQTIPGDISKLLTFFSNNEDRSAIEQTSMQKPPPTPKPKETANNLLRKIAASSSFNFLSRISPGPTPLSDSYSDGPTPLSDSPTPLSDSYSDGSTPLSDSSSEISPEPTPPSDSSGKSSSVNSQVQPSSALLPRSNGKRFGVVNVPALHVKSGASLSATDEIVTETILRNAEEEEIVSANYVKIELDEDAYMAAKEAAMKDQQDKSRKVGGSSSSSGWTVDTLYRLEGGCLRFDTLLQRMQRGGANVSRRLQDMPMFNFENQQDVLLVSLLALVGQVHFLKSKPPLHFEPLSPSASLLTSTRQISNDMKSARQAIASGRSVSDASASKATGPGLPVTVLQQKIMEKVLEAFSKNPTREVKTVIKEISKDAITAFTAFRMDIMAAANKTDISNDMAYMDGSNHIDKTMLGVANAAVACTFIVCSKDTHIGQNLEYCAQECEFVLDCIETDVFPNMARNVALCGLGAAKLVRAICCIPKMREKYNPMTRSVLLATEDLNLPPMMSLSSDSDDPWDSPYSEIEPIACVCALAAMRSIRVFLSAVARGSLITVDLIMSSISNSIETTLMKPVWNLHDGRNTMVGMLTLVLARYMNGYTDLHDVSPYGSSSSEKWTIQAAKNMKHEIVRKHRVTLNFDEFINQGVRDVISAIAVTAGLSETSRNDITDKIIGKLSTYGTSLIEIVQDIGEVVHTVVSTPAPAAATPPQPSGATQAPATQPQPPGAPATQQPPGAQLTQQPSGATQAPATQPQPPGAPATQQPSGAQLTQQPSGATQAPAPPSYVPRVDDPDNHVDGTVKNKPAAGPIAPDLLESMASGVSSLGTTRLKMIGVIVGMAGLAVAPMATMAIMSSSSKEAFTEKNLKMVGHPPPPPVAHIRDVMSDAEVERALDILRRDFKLVPLLLTDATLLAGIVIGWQLLQYAVAYWSPEKDARASPTVYVNAIGLSWMATVLVLAVQDWQRNLEL